MSYFFYIFFQFRTAVPCICIYIPVAMTIGISHILKVFQCFVVTHI